MKTKLAASLAFVLALSIPAFAQKGGGGKGGGFGGGDFGGRDREGNRIRWSSNIDGITDSKDPFEAERRKRMGMEPIENKYLFVYIRPIAETQDPNEFNNNDIVELSYNQWIFVKMDFDKDNVHQKGWGVKAAPACLGCDLHGNDFNRTGNPSLGEVRRITGGLPELIARYEQKLKSDFTKANEIAKTDDSKAVKLYVEIVANGKKGYKEVVESATKLGDYAQSALKRADLPESVSPEAGIDYLEDLAKLFKGAGAEGKATGPSVQAEIRIARLDYERGNVKAAIQRLLAILKYDPKLKAEIDNAARALEEMSHAGEAKVELAVTGDRALAKETLRKLASDYAGTEAAKRALEAAKRFE